MINILSDPSYFLPPLIGVAGTFALFIVALLWSRRDFTTVLFCGILMSMALVNLCVFGMRSSPDVYRALLWEKGLAVPTLAAYVLYYHFTLVYTDTRGQRRILHASYLFLIVIAVIAPTDLIIEGMRVEAFGYAPVIGPAGFSWFAAGPLLALGGAYNLLKYYKVCPSYAERNRLIYLAVAAVFPLTGALLDGFTNLPPVFIWSNLIFCILCTIAIVRYHLLDIRVFIRKSSVYLLVSVVVAVPYVAMLYGLYRIFELQIAAWWLHASLILLLAIILRPLYGWAQNLVDRLFYRDRYDSLRALEAFSRRTQSLTDSARLGDIMVDLVSSALRPSSVHLLQPPPLSNDFATVSSAGVRSQASSISLSNSSALIKWLKRSKEMLSYRDLDIIPQLQGLVANEKEALSQIKAELIIPLKTRIGQLSGLLILGQKLSQEPYTIEDRQLLYTISTQMISNLENARLYNEVTQVRKDLENWLNSMTDCVMIVNTHWGIQFVNMAGVEKFGARAGEKCWCALGKDAVCSGCPIPHYLGGSTDGLHYSSNIRHREYDIAVAPLLDADGSLSVIEVLRDVTESKRAQEEIVRLLRTIENAREAINVTSSDGQIIYTNCAMDELFGYEKGRLIGKHPSVLNAVPTPEAVTKEIMAGIGKKGYWEGEIHNKRKDGTEFLSYARISSLVDEHGKILNFLSTQHDITERKRIESALRESEEFNVSLLTNSPNSILVFDLSASIRYVNPALEKLTGFSSAELVGRKPPFPWWIEETRKESSRELEKAMHRGARKYDQLFRRKNGEHFWVGIAFKTIKVAGERKYHLANWVDLTEQKRLRGNMEFYISQITRAQEKERKRIARELHDESIQSLASLALEIDAITQKKERLPEDVVRRLKGVRAETNIVLDNLRRFSHNLRPGVIDQTGLVPGLEILVEELNEAGGINASLQITGSETRLRPETELALFRITQEALRNARKHSGATDVMIKLRFTHNKTRLSISDNGRGFKLPRMLGDFATGNKLGIIGMQERTRLVNGEFLVKSHIGKGTTVIVVVEL